jgi:hypothetical protein
MRDSVRPGKYTLVLEPDLFPQEVEVRKGETTRVELKIE